MEMDGTSRSLEPRVGKMLVLNPKVTWRTYLQVQHVSHSWQGLTCANIHNTPVHSHWMPRQWNAHQTKEQHSAHWIDHVMVCYYNCISRMASNLPWHPDTISWLPPGETPASNSSTYDWPTNIQNHHQPHMPPQWQCHLSPIWTWR